jgi:hypothetical protein
LNQNDLDYNFETCTVELKYQFRKSCSCEINRIFYLVYQRQVKLWISHKTVKIKFYIFKDKVNRSTTICKRESENVGFETAETPLFKGVRYSLIFKET